MKIRLLLLTVTILVVGVIAIGYSFYRDNISISYAKPGVSRESILQSLVVDDGYEISIFADANDIPLRQIAVADDGWIFVGSLKDNVYAFKDADNDGKAEKRLVVAANLSNPHGVVYHDGDLYIGAIPTIYIIRNVLGELDNAPIVPEPFISGLPKGGHHGLRHLGVGPDNMLYVSFGVPCNICLPPSDLTGVIRRYALDGTDDGKVYARGIRNSVGFDFHPRSGELWFTDNGRDWLGDDLPSDELNRVTRIDEHFGYPYCHQGDLPDPEFGEGRRCADYSPPALLTGAHVASLGMAFNADGSRVYIALRGSWNRSEKIGYAVNRAVIEGNSVSEYKPFASGWLRQDGTVYGRPVDVAFLANGDLLVSDDFLGMLYRIASK